MALTVTANSDGSRDTREVGGNMAISIGTCVAVLTV